MQVRVLGVALVCALAAVASSGGKDGSASEKSTSTAAAVSVSAAAGARIGTPALNERAGTITDLIAKNDWAAVRKDFDVTMLGSVSERKLADGWTEVTDRAGAYASRGEPAAVDKPGGFAVYDTTMNFARGPAKSRVAFSADGKIAGLFLLPPSAP